MVTLLDSEGQQTLLEVTLRGPHAMGVADLDLAGRGVTLRAGQSYQWFVSVLAGEDPGPGDAVAGGGIERAHSSTELQQMLKAAGPSKAPHVFAKFGLCYDALAAVSKLIASSPNDASLRAQRVALLEEAGLDAAAAFDRGD